MEHVAEASRAPPGHQPPDSTWIQITFTLDPEHYRALWERAEEEHRTLPDLVRESVMDSLNKVKSVTRKKNKAAKRKGEDSP